MITKLATTVFDKGSKTSYSCALPSGLRYSGVKDLLFVWVSSINSTDPSAITGYTQMVKRSYTKDSITVTLWGYWKLAEAADDGGTLSVTFASSYHRLVSVDVYRGVYNTTPIQSHTETDNSTGGHTIGSRTPTYPQSFFITGSALVYIHDRYGIAGIDSISCDNGIVIDSVSDRVSYYTYPPPANSYGDYVALGVGYIVPGYAPVANISYTITASCRLWGIDSFAVLTPDPAGPTISESGVASDLPSSDTKIYAESGVGTDRTNFNKVVSEVGLSNDRARTPFRDILAYEFPVATDVGAQITSIVVADSGAGAEVPNETNNVTLSDTGTGDDIADIDYGFSSVIVRFSGTSASINFTGYKEEVQ